MFRKNDDMTRTPGIQQYPRRVEDDDIRSFIARPYRPWFDRRARKVLGLAWGQKVCAFILARGDWSAD